MKEMSKTYAIVEVIEGEQIQLVRQLFVCRTALAFDSRCGVDFPFRRKPQLDGCSGSSNSQPQVSDYKMSHGRGGGVEEGQCLEVLSYFCVDVCFCTGIRNVSRV